MLSEIRIRVRTDRNFLVDDPKDKTFAAFGDARFKIENGQVNLVACTQQQKISMV
jgi:hypothetical protein